MDKREIFDNAISCINVDKEQRRMFDLPEEWEIVEQIRKLHRNDEATFERKEVKNRWVGIEVDIYTIPDPEEGCKYVIYIVDGEILDADYEESA